MAVGLFAEAQQSATIARVDQISVSQPGARPETREAAFGEVHGLTAYGRNLPGNGLASADLDGIKVLAMAILRKQSDEESG